MNYFNKPLFSALLFLLVVARPVFAGSFTISGSSATAQTLGTGSGQAGTINLGSSLTISGTTNAVTISGNNATLTNLGTLSQTGSARAIRDNTGVTGLIVNNGSPTNSTALMQTSDSDVIQMNKTGATVTLNNYGTMTSLNVSAGGSQAVDFNAILNGTTAAPSNFINNYSTGLMQASEADAVRPGVSGVVYNAGTIKSTTSTGSSSDGIDAQNNSLIQITNDTTGLLEGARHGITGAAVDNTVTFTMSITNNAGGIIKGDNGSGLNIDGFNANESVTIVNHGTITGNGHDLGNNTGHDGDGVDVDGLVNITNTGTIRSINSFGAIVNSVQTIETSEGVTVGGGTINNSGTIEGDVAAGNTTAIGRGITLAGVDKDAAGAPIPVQTIYGDSTITNSGLIKGQSDSGIAVGGVSGPTNFKVTITNQTTGIIEGGGNTAAAIQGGLNDMTINNSGLIKADNSGKAIVMGAGNNTLNILGGSASILGDVDGGIGGTNSLVIDPGANNTFSYAGTITHFATAQIKSGTFSLSGAMTAGGTIVNGGTLAGTGTVTGLVTVTTGGTVSPGNSPGKLTLQTGVDLSGGGKYFWQLASLTDDTSGTAGTDFDQILLTGGNLTLGGTSLITLDFSLLGGSDPNSADSFWGTTHSWTIIDGTGATNAGNTNFSQITDATFAHGFFTTSSDANGDTVLNYQSVPEPASVSLLAFGALGLLARRRRA